MSNLPGMQDRIHQNGHFPSEPVLGEERGNLDNYSSNKADSRLEIPVNSNDNWSYLTKDWVDTLPQVWSRGLLYFLVIFAGIILP